MSDRPESPPAGVTLLAPEAARKAMGSAAGPPPSAPGTQETALLLVPHPFGFRDWLWMAGLTGCILMAVFRSAPSAAPEWTVVPDPDISVIGLWKLFLKESGAAVLALLSVIALLGWLAAAVQRTWLLAGAESVRVLTRTPRGRKCQEFRREDIESVQFSLQQTDGRGRYEISLRLKREDAGVFDAGPNRAGARFAAFVLSQAAGLPVRSDTPLNLPGEEQYPFFLPDDPETGIRVKNGIFAQSAALSGVRQRPEELCIFDTEDREFRAFLRQVYPAMTAETERDSCFAVRESFRSGTAAALTLGGTALVLLAAAGDPDFFLGPAVRLFGRDSWLDWNVLPDALPLAFLAGMAAAVTRIPRWLVGQRWYVFFGDSLMVFDRCLTVRLRKTLPRTGWTGAETAGGFGYRARLRSRPHPGGPEEKVTAGVFSSRETAAWFAGVLRTWLGHG